MKATVLFWYLSLHLFAHILLPSTTHAWYDTSTRPEDIMLTELPPLPKEHNPRRGVLAVKRAVRHPNHAMALINSVRTSQEPREHVRKARMNHQEYSPPVIGHFSPVGAPTKGGVLVKFWGINFDGGSIYKCCFHNAVVKAEYHKDPSHLHHDTITCMAPAFSATGSKTPEGVDVSIIIFANSTNNNEESAKKVHHHSQSHRRRFMYYATSRHPEGGTDANGNNLNGTGSLYAQIFIHLAAPSSGPITGGTTIQIPGRFLLDHKDGYNCRFGSTVVPAIAEHMSYQLRPNNLVVDEVLTCVSPPNPSSRSVRFQVEHASVETDKNGTKSSRIGAKGSFHYYKPPGGKSGEDEEGANKKINMLDLATG
jgi:hypothetical protein